MNPLNATTWLDAGMVASYAGDTGLQAPEARILGELRARMAGGSMLDIGVGAGRTTRHFAPAVAEYVGVDISPWMVEHCRRHFASAGARFEVADVRDLSAFGPRRFDFVLFSFNGLDYLAHADRLQALAQVHRVCRPGASFCFSTHNMGAVPHLMRLRAQFTRDRAWLWRNLRNWVRWRVRHARHAARVAADGRDWAILNDGAHDCRLDTYYVRPAAQLAQLAPWFAGTRVLSLAGEELIHDSVEAAKDDWLYYLCRAR
jgi:SAM-dependent methyltransferase